MISSKIKGFTLIELLIVIVIIGVLAVALIPRLKGIQDRARIRAANIQMQDFNTAIVMARIHDFKTLQNITQDGCSACSCPLTGDHRTLPEDHICRVKRRSALSKITLAAGMDSGALKSLEKDPWGSPYLLDENEGEFGTGDCRRDSLYSAGPDGLRRGTDDINLSNAPAFCPGAY